jgi:hypothetical protein
MAVKRDIIKVEDVEERLRRAADELAKSGEDAGAEARERARDAGKDFRSIETPRYASAFLAEARRALEEDVNIARPAEVEDDVEPIERDREIAKKALAGLKLDQLRRIAESRGLERRGKEEAVIDRIVTSYEMDWPAIAQLILENEEPRPERGVSDRVFPILEDQIDLDEGARRFMVFRRRYIRTGIARWFVFGEADMRNRVLFLDGTFRTYRVDAVEEDEKTFDLLPTPTVIPVRVRLASSARSVEVRAKGATESRAAAQAVMKVLGLHPSRGLPIAAHPPEGELMQWDPRSVFMVAFLQNELDRAGIEILNLTSASFETGDAPEGTELRPAVRSVRFEGAHLLSSKPACELLVESRGLVDMTLLARFKPAPNDEGSVHPLRISLERDHIAVLTGFGSTRPERARDLQREILNRLGRALGAPLANERELNELARRIRQRARQDEPVDRADILAPAESWIPDDE